MLNLTHHLDRRLTVVHAKIMQRSRAEKITLALMDEDGAYVLTAGQSVLICAKPEGVRDTDRLVLVTITSADYDEDREVYEQIFSSDTTPVRTLIADDADADDDVAAVTIDCNVIFVPEEASEEEEVGNCFKLTLENGPYHPDDVPPTAADGSHIISFAWVPADLVFSAVVTDEAGDTSTVELDPNGGGGGGGGNVSTAVTLTNNVLILGAGGSNIKVATTGTGVVTALGVAVGSAGAFVVYNGALGTPSSGDGQNLTALNATQLTSGTVPDARFPSTLPALNGSALTALTASNITNSTTVGRALLNLTNPGAVRFLRINADNTVTARSASDFLSDIGAIDGSALNADNLSSGTVPPARLGSGSSITTKFLRGDSTWQTIGGGGDMLAANNLSDVASAATSRTNLGASTVGAAIFTLTNPGAVTFIRINADNTITARTAAQFLSDIGGIDGSALNASNLSSGTVPDARFPATLPALNGSALTALTAANITNSTTVGRAVLNLTNPSAITFLRVNADNTVTARTAAQFLSDIGGIDGSALNASNLSSGTVPDARFPSTLPAVSGANLTNLDASDLASGTIPDARMPDLTGVVTTVQGAVATTLSDRLQIAVSDTTTDLTTGTAKVTFRMPYAMTLTAVRASVSTAPTGSTLIVDINEDAGGGSATILSTKLSIDASEKTSATAASAAVISDSSLADDAEITIDIDQIGASTPGKGLVVTLIGTRTS